MQAAIKAGEYLFLFDNYFIFFAASYPFKIGISQSIKIKLIGFYKFTILLDNLNT